MASRPSQEKIAIVGAGMGGLAAAIDLARRGLSVVVFERGGRPGGKMREVEVDGAMIDVGPTVLTMRSVFDELFAEAGASLDDHVTLTPLAVLARHAWRNGDALDLHADPHVTEAAVGDFAGAAAVQGYRRFRARSQSVYETLQDTFIRAARPGPLDIARQAGLADMWRIRPFAHLWQELGEYFIDKRLRQIFARYATYCGSSPFLAPATLMLIAHVEQAGVWTVQGGMQALARALVALGRRHGVDYRFGAHVREIATEAGRASAVVLADGERIDLDAVVVNADVAALAGGAFGVSAAQGLSSARPPRSLSALTFAFRAHTSGFALARHNVFFCDDYRAEFDDLFGRSRLPHEPTVYACAQDRPDGAAPDRKDRLFCLVNAPATGDAGKPTPQEIEQCQAKAFASLERCGLRIETPERIVTTGPVEFARLFPATGGALYGRATHGWRAAFARPGSRTKTPGLYLAGGGAHPGPGVPMATISGRLAAAALLEDLDSRARSRPAAMRGGMSTR